MTTNGGGNTSRLQVPKIHCAFPEMVLWLMLPRVSFLYRSSECTFFPTGFQRRTLLACFISRESLCSNSAVDLLHTFMAETRLA